MCKRKNYSIFSRSPIQCLNPLQLQKPGEGCGLDDAELGNVSRAEEEDGDAKYQRALHRTFRYALIIHAVFF